MQTEEQIWAQICKIRGSWRDSKELKVALEEWESDFGPAYHQLAEEILARKIRAQWALNATKWNSRSFDPFIRIMWEDWNEGEFTLTKTPTSVQIRCTRCPIADSYRSIGKQELGFIFQCSEDPHIVAGYNPRMIFRRTRTLMLGDDLCDHYYELKANND